MVEPGPAKPIMTTHPAQDLQADPTARPPALRLVLGGALMGLANLVPGISGGTMLVAAGVYRRFIDAVSDATRLRLTRPTVLTLGLIGLAAAGAVAVGAGPVAFGLDKARWAMYALFIGLTLGGVPSLWAMVRPLCRGSAAFIAAGLLAMLTVVFVQESGLGVGVAGAAEVSGWPMLVVAGAAGAAAMVLPGVSGAYLLLLLGQYEAVVNAIKDLARGDLGTLSVLVPLGVGVGVGVAGVGNALRWLLHRHERATLAFLLGLLLGAPAGLYPFREAVQPSAGDVVKGVVLTEETAAEVPPKDWPTRTFTPHLSQIGASIGLVVLGVGATVGVARLGRGRAEGRSEPTPEDGQ